MFSNITRRALHTSVPARTVTESVKKAAQNANLKVGQTLATGIGKAEEAVEATQETLGVGKEKAKEQAEEKGTMAKQKLNETASTARQKKQDIQQDLNKRK